MMRRIVFTSVLAGLAFSPLGRCPTSSATSR